MTAAPPPADPQHPTDATEATDGPDATDAPRQSVKRRRRSTSYSRLRGSATRPGRAWGSDEGRVTAFTVVFATAVLLFAGLVLDGGLALAAKVRAVGEAQEAARAGAQAIDLGAYRADGTLRLDPDRAAALARSYLTGAHTADAGTDTGTDTGPAAAAVTVSGDSVTVTVSATQSTRLLGLVGVHSIRVTGTGTAHPDRGPAAGGGAGP